MKAVVLKRPGSVDQLVTVDMPRPEPRPDEVLVKVRAATVTQGDVVMRKLPRLVARLFGETPKTILGHEYAGDIVAVGDDVTAFEVGDRVFGTTSGLGQGSHAEYLAAPANGVIDALPDNVGYEEIAPVPVASMTALHFLDEGAVGAGDMVLINGASGSVGSFAVQIAKQRGAHVTGVASTANLEFVRSLGADAVVDYTRDDFTDGGQAFDVVFDVAGKTTAKKARPILTQAGRFVTTRQRRKETVEELRQVRVMVAESRVKAIVDSVYPLDDIRAAYEHVETGSKRGSIVLQIS